MAWLQLKTALEATLENMDDSAQIITRDWIQQRTATEKAVLLDDRMSVAEEFQRVEVNGIKIYYPKLDTLNEAVIATVQELAVTRFPPMLHRYINGIILTTQSGGDVEGFGPVVATAGDGDRNIVVYNQLPPTSLTLAHEAAHNLALDKYTDTAPPSFSDYRQAMNTDEPPVSDYARSGSTEDFAEAVALYVVNPERLRLIAPERFKVITRLMTDPEYGG